MEMEPTRPLPGATSSRQRRRVVFFVVALLGIVSICVYSLTGNSARPTARSPFHATTTSTGASTPAEVPDLAAVRRAAWERVQQKLKHADHSSLRAAEQSADGLRAFFQKCKDGTPAFAEVALGWKSKRLVIWERMPFTEPNQHRTYLDEQFQQKVFSQSELAAVLESCGSDFRQAIDGIENRQDLEDFPAIVLPPTPQEAQAEFERLAQAIANDSALDVGIEVGKLATATAIESVMAGRAWTAVATPTGAREPRTLTDVTG